MTPVTAIPSSSLQLGTIPHPARLGTNVLFFRDWQTASAHLRDHLLTAPECAAWALVAPEYRRIVDPTAEDARWSYAKQALATKGVSAQPLYDLYCEATGCDARDAATLGWVRSDGAVTVALGTSGILMVIEDALMTAFLPGQG